MLGATSLRVQRDRTHPLQPANLRLDQTFPSERPLLAGPATPISARQPARFAATSLLGFATWQHADCGEIRLLFDIPRRRIVLSIPWFVALVRSSAKKSVVDVHRVEITSRPEHPYTRALSELASSCIAGRPSAIQVSRPSSSIQTSCRYPLRSRSWSCVDIVIWRSGYGMLIGI